jgi:hypothetical protein
MATPFLVRVKARLTRNIGTGAVIELRDAVSGELLTVFLSFRTAGEWLATMGYRYSLGTPGIWSRRAPR